MKNVIQRLRDRIEAGFETWGQITLKYPWQIIAVIAVFTGYLLWNAQNIKVEANTESFLKTGDPARVTYSEFRKEFGTDEVIVLVLRSDDLFNVKFLQQLRALHFDLEDNLPFVDDIKSLVNARVTHGTEDSLISEDLMAEWPRDLESPPDPALLEKMRKEAFRNPLYENLFVSKDHHYTMITIKLEPGEAAIDEAVALEAQRHDPIGHAEDTNMLLDSKEVDQVATKLIEILDRHRTADFPIWTAGAPPMTYEILRTMQHDMTIFSGVAFAGMAVLLFFLFRRLVGIFLPLLTVGLPLASTFGIMSMVGIPITPATQIMPSFLLAAGIGYSIHILAIYLHEIDSGKPHEEALVYTIGHSGLAVLLTAATTAGGLISFAFVDLAPLAGFGVSAPLGVLLCFLYSVVLLPALLCVIHIKPRHEYLKLEENTKTDAFLAAVGATATRHPWRAVVAWVIIFIVFGYGASQLRMSHNSIKWFKPEHPLRQAVQVASDHFGSSMSLELIVDTKRENGLHDPAVMNAIEEIKNYAQDLRVGEVFIGKAIAVSDVVKETNQALHDGDPAFYTIPQDRVTIAQELLLFESSGTDDLDDLVTSQFDKARITLTVPFCDATDYVAFQEVLDKKAQEVFHGIAETRVTGAVALMSRTIKAMLSSMLQSYLMSFLNITPFMILLVGDILLGSLSMLPNIAPIVIGMGLMHYLKVPLDMFAALIGSIAIGVVVDDTIHFLHNFKRYTDHGDSPEVATHKTLLSAGRALLFMCLVLVLGFAVFMGASMVNIINFGKITSLVIASGFAADMTLTPAMTTIIMRHRQKKALKKASKLTKTA